ncbi:hypothetical protein I4U23_026616 [Adineta vaga]|nr:hypothetical protein I4U23_026616 [Adineta vaga]
MNSTWIIPIDDVDVNLHEINSTSSTILSYTISNQTHLNAILSSKTTFITLIFLVSFMTLITVFGNLLVIIAFICDSRIRTYSNCFILNLSIADLLVGLICIPLYAHKFIFDEWYLGYHLCKLWLVFDYVVGSASTLCIVVISYDRYQMVSKGLDYLSNISIQRALKFVFGTWIIAILNYGPAIILWDWLPGNEPYQYQTCDPPFAKHFPYLVTTACVEFFVPFFSLIILNLLVYSNIRQRSRGLIRTNTLQLRQNGHVKTLLSAQISSEPNIRSSRKQSKSIVLLRDRRAAKNLFILVFAFINVYRH